MILAAERSAAITQVTVCLARSAKENVSNVLVETPIDPRLILGALGGGSFPRIGHFFAYCLVLFINLMLASVIGKDPGERMFAFVLFGFIECLFLASGRLVRK